jgi:sensor histidine kinase YesM
MVKVKDKWLRLIAITVISLIAIYSNKLYQQPFSWPLLQRILLIIVSITLTWQGNRWIILHFRKKLSGSQELIKRIAFTFLTGILFTWLILVCTTVARYVILYGAATAWEEVSNGQVFINLFTNAASKSLLVFTLFFGIYEALYYHARLNQSEEEKKQLEKEKLWSQLEKLNQEVNPHFLFNTLNSLSSLITEDPQEAEKFLNEMSKVYRYLLDNNKHELVTLETELKFIRSFYQLLKLRYGKGIELAWPATTVYNDYLLPPLTLQLLVENAVKHNTTSKENPLQIEILVTDNAQLTVKNTLQKRATRPLSHKIGLSNIAAKYQIMQQGEIIVKETEGSFMVSVPLIAPKSQTTPL